MTIFIRLCLLVLSFIGLGSCDLINHAYDIQVSPHPPYSNSRMFWLNNDEIMFVGQDLFDTKKEKLNVYKWNVSNSKTEEIISDVNGICYNRGYVRYGKKISGTTTLFSGTMGKEQQEAIVNAGEYGSLTCKPVQANVHNFYDAPNPRFHLLQLLEEDGVLELPPQLDNATAYLHSQTSIKPKPIPKLNFWNTYGASNEFMYIPHLGAYLISGQENGGKSYKLLYPNGSVVDYPIPDGNWDRNNTGSFSILPVKNATIVVDWNNRENIFGKSMFFGRSHEPKGAYLVKNNNTTQIIPKDLIISPLSISPNGCRVAFNYGEKKDFMEYKLGYVDVCNE